MNEWINIAEKFPPEETQYLVWCLHTQQVEMLTWCDVYGCWDDTEGDDHRYDIEQTSHWMKLPTRPNSHYMRAGDKYGKETI